MQNNNATGDDNRNVSIIKKRNSAREYGEEEYPDEEDPEWNDIDVSEIEKNKIDFKALPDQNSTQQQEKINIKESKEELNKSSVSNTEDSKEDDDALNRLVKISSDIISKQDCLNILPTENKIKNDESVNLDNNSKNIKLEGKTLDANNIFNIGNLLLSNEKKNNATESNMNSEDSKRNFIINFEQLELQNSLFGKNLFDIFIQDQNLNNQENNPSLENLEDALIKNLINSTNLQNINNSNSNIFNKPNNNDFIESSPDKQNILLKSLNFSSDLQKKFSDNSKLSEDIEAENTNMLEFNPDRNNNHIPNNDYNIINQNNTLGGNIGNISYESPGNDNISDLKKDFYEKFNEQLKLRGINPENFNQNVVNTNFNNFLFNSLNLANSNSVNHPNNNINVPNKNLINNQIFNNRINVPTAIPNIITPANMIPYPLINRDILLNNMFQQGLIKPNLNLSIPIIQKAQPQSIQNNVNNNTNIEHLKNSEREKGNSGNTEFLKEKSLSYLENPTTVIQKNLVKKGWALMGDNNKPYKFLNSVELQSYLETEKKNNKIHKLNWISDFESDMFFKPSDLLEELTEALPKLIENLTKKSQQQQQKNLAPTNTPDIRLLGMPILNNPNIANIQNNIDNKDNQLKISPVNINMNPHIYDQRILNMNMNMNMIPPFAAAAAAHMGSMRPNNMAGISNINNNFNGQAVNMNINLQFVNNDIKLNNILVGENPNNSNSNAGLNINQSTNLPNNNNNNTNNKEVNVNQIPPGFNKAFLQNFPKGQNIPGFPNIAGMPPNFNLAAMNNMYLTNLNNQILNNNNISNNASNQSQNNKKENFNNNNNSNHGILNVNNQSKLNSILNLQEEAMTKNEINSFFGSNVFYETLTINPNNQNIENPEGINIKATKNLNANQNKNISNKSTRVNNSNQTVNLKNTGLINNKNNSSKKNY